MQDIAMTSPTKVAITRIIIDALMASWEKRKRLAQVAALPSLALIVIATYWSYADRKVDTLDAMVWVALWTMAFSPFALTCHRVLLLGNDSLPQYGIMRLTKREMKFLAWLSAIGLIGFLVKAISIMTIGSVLVNAIEIQNDWLVRILKGADVLAAYLVARLSLILPSIALDEQLSLSHVWHLSQGNGIRLTIILVGLPWLLAYYGQFIFPEEMNLAQVTLCSILYCVALLVEVAVLSFSYKALASLTLSPISRDDGV